MRDITLTDIKNLLTETLSIERDGIKQLLDAMESRLRGEMHDMGRDVREELHQAISDELGGISQETRGLRQEMRDMRQEMRDGFQAVGEAIVRIHDDIDEHGHRISRLEKRHRPFGLQT